VDSRQKLWNQSSVFGNICTSISRFSGCMFEGREVGNGLSVSPAGQPCRRCECSSGVISCRDPTCDCSVSGGSASDKCCPQCDPNAACRHQELKHVVFRSGERWIYQCQTCECLVSFYPSCTSLHLYPPLPSPNLWLCMNTSWFKTSNNRNAGE